MPTRGKGIHFRKDQDFSTFPLELRVTIPHGTSISRSGPFSNKNYYLDCIPPGPLPPRPANQLEGKWRERTTKKQENRHVCRMPCHPKKQSVTFFEGVLGSAVSFLRFSSGS